MRKLFCLLLALTMLFGASALAETAPEENLFTPGTYTAEEQGIFAPVKVQITVSENLITNVLIDATGETPELGGKAAAEMAQAILYAQTPNVDGLSGATVTSDAIRKAGPEAKNVTASRSRKEASFLTERDVDHDDLKTAIDATGYTCLGITSAPYEKKGLFGWR